MWNNPTFLSGRFLFWLWYALQCSVVLVTFKNTFSESERSLCQMNPTDSSQQSCLPSALGNVDLTSRVVRPCSDSPLWGHPQHLPFLLAHREHPECFYQQFLLWRPVVAAKRGETSEIIWSQIIHTWDCVCWQKRNKWRGEELCSSNREVTEPPQL